MSNEQKPAVEAAITDQIRDQLRGPLEGALLPAALKTIANASDEVGMFVRVYADQLAGAIAAGRPDLVERVHERQGALAALYDLTIDEVQANVLRLAATTATDVAARLLSTVLGGPVAAFLSGFLTPKKG